MQDWSDKYLDLTIEAALHSRVVTPQQKRLAWERLRDQVEAQTSLPPVMLVERSRDRRSHSVAGAVRSSLFWLMALLLDDSSYDRALRNRPLYAACGIFEVPLRNMIGGMAV